MHEPILRNGMVMKKDLLLTGITRRKGIKI